MFQILQNYPVTFASNFTKCFINLCITHSVIVYSSHNMILQCNVLPNNLDLGNYISVARFYLWFKISFYIKMFFIPSQESGWLCTFFVYVLGVLIWSLSTMFFLLDFGTVSIVVFFCFLFHYSMTRSIIFVKMKDCRINRIIRYCHRYWSYFVHCFKQVRNAW